MAQNIVEVTDDNFESVVLQSDKLVVVDFWAEWCGPCRIVSPILEELAKENPNVLICKMNVDENSEVPTQMGIRNIPTLLFFKGGKVVNKFVGAATKSEYQRIINDSL
ncbi:MAG: thioredoxin [Bacteroidia bacterium]|nr:thioredoxin [Bacteroidia bacterium]MDW8301917.1 thioredoxin [Bacteroidia bacterium]